MKQAAPTLSRYLLEGSDPTEVFGLAQQIRALLVGRHLNAVYSALALATATSIHERGMSGMDMLDPAAAPDAAVAATGLLTREHLRAVTAGTDMAVTPQQAARMRQTVGAA